MDDGVLWLLYTRLLLVMLYSVMCFSGPTFACSPPPCTGFGVYFDPPAPYWITEGDVMPNITGGATCNPSPCLYNWTRDRDDELMSDTDVLSLGIVEEDDDGWYTFMARTPGEPCASIKGAIQVQFICDTPPCTGNVTFEPPNAKYYAWPGLDMYNITCATGCNPAPCSYNWTRDKDDKLMSNTDVLSLGILKKGDDGVYTCMARTPGEPHVYAQEQLIVSYGCNTPPCIGAVLTLKPPGPTYQENIGDVMPNITCHCADCNPGPCLYNWTRVRDGKLMSDTDVLSLGTLQKGDDSAYDCMVRTSGYPYDHRQQAIEVQFDTVNVGLIVGLTLGGATLVAIIGLAVLFVSRRRRNYREKELLY